VKNALALLTMWRNTRLVVLVSVIAAIHAAALIPFKPIVIIPGITEVRPGMVFPLVFSLLFGPAAAWGTAIGNTIGDLFGSLGPGTLFGFLGNLLYGYLPYHVWHAWKGSRPAFRAPGDWAIYLLVVVAAAGACALVIGWGVHLLGLVPFAATSGVILVNNLLVGIVLGPPFILAIHPRVARLNLLYEDIAGAPSGDARSSRLIRRAASLAVAASALAGLAAGYTASATASSDTAVTAAATPFVLAVIAAALFV
jgi:energy-coupling factor transport system substrate-specific component